MRFVIFGAGAIGGVVGGRLAQHGHDVVLIARGEHAAVLRSDGLRIEDPETATTVAVPVVEHPSQLEIRPGDVVLLAVKSQQTKPALDDLRSVAPPDLPVVCVQNGVSNERDALRTFEHVYGVCVMCPASHLEPGIVQAHASPVSGILDIGRYPAGVDDTSREIAAALARSTFVSEPRADIMRWKYGKLIMNLGNAVEALCGSTDGAAELARRARSEGAACLRAAGIDAVSAAEDRERRGDLLTIAAVGGRPRGGGSTWQSLQRGLGSVESDHLNGEIVLLGRLHGVPTPVNETLQRLVHDAATGLAAPGSVAPTDVLSVLDEAG